MGHICQAGFNLGRAQAHAMSGESGKDFVVTAARRLELSKRVNDALIKEFRKISDLWESRKGELPGVFTQLQHALGLHGKEYHAVSAGYILGLMRDADKVGKTQGLAAKTVSTSLLEAEFLGALDKHLNALGVSSVVQQTRNNFYNQVRASTSWSSLSQVLVSIEAAFLPKVSKVTE